MCVCVCVCVCVRVVCVSVSACVCGRALARHTWGKQRAYCKREGPHSRSLAAVGGVRDLPKRITSAQYLSLPTGGRLLYMGKSSISTSAPHPAKTNGRVRARNNQSR